MVSSTSQPAFESLWQRGIPQLQISFISRSNNVNKNHVKLVVMRFIATASVFLLFGEQTIQAVKAMASGPPGCLTKLHTGLTNT
jgi:hypothetical protein